jgi:CRISPR-associated endonuclease/helicase Cas3
MIDDQSRSVLVPWGDEGRALVALVCDRFAPDWRLKRRLQRYTVSVPEWIYQKLLASDIQVMHECFPVLINPSAYDEKLGLRADRAGHHEPESLVI